VNIRWLWRDYIPPGLALSELERGRVHRRARELRPTTWRHAANRNERRIYNRHYAPVGIVLGLWGLYAMYSQIVLHQHLSAFVLLGIQPILFAGMWISLCIARGKTHAPYVCRALRELGHDVCPECGYLLKGLSTDAEDARTIRCPECGWDRIKEEAQEADRRDASP